MPPAPPQTHTWECRTPLALRAASLPGSSRRFGFGPLPGGATVLATRSRAAGRGFTLKFPGFFVRHGKKFSQNWQI